MQSSGTGLEWGVFSVLIIGMLFLDLFIFRKASEDKDHVFRQGVIWSIIWITLSLLFNVYVWVVNGGETAANFFTAYIVEKSLSVDNLFVFLAIFSYFGIPARFQHRVLFWGVLSALVLRGIFILGGTYLLSSFHWMFYVFGAFLVFTGIKLVFQQESGVDPEKNLAIRLARKYLPVHPELEGDRFFVVKEGRRLATPMAIVLIAIEFTDVLFATDSVPAVLGITEDLFVVYTSNIFAILGLRALYFVIAGMLSRIYYLNYGLAAVLCFIGLKMILSTFYHISVLISLGVIAGLLGLAVAASLVRARRRARSEGEHPAA